MQAPRTLASAPFRATPKRIALMAVLQKAGQPLSAEVLHSQMQEIDLVTVYRNLQEFLKAGIVHEVRFKDGIVRYELAHTHHHHIVCTTCGLVEELDMCDVALEKKALKHARHFRTVSEHALEFFGVCKKCA